MVWTPAIHRAPLRFSRAGRPIGPAARGAQRDPAKILTCDATKSAASNTIMVKAGWGGITKGRCVMTITQLVTQAQAGSRAAFGELYESLAGDLYRMALYTLGSQQDAEDAVADTFAEAWKGIKNLREPEAFRSWMWAHSPRRNGRSCCSRCWRAIPCGRLRACWRCRRVR